MTSARAAPLRLVLDSNVWLDWLVFDDEACAPLKRTQAAGDVEIYIDDACERELAAVLGYDFGKHTLDANARAACLDECKRLARRSDTRTTGVLPKCSDPDDQKFLELARACGAGYLVTKDKALLVLARRKTHPPPCRIVTPSEMGALLETTRGQMSGNLSRSC